MTQAEGEERLYTKIIVSAHTQHWYKIVARAKQIACVKQTAQSCSRVRSQTKKNTSQTNEKLTMVSQEHVATHFNSDVCSSKKTIWIPYMAESSTNPKMRAILATGLVSGSSKSHQCNSWAKSVLELH